MADDLFPLNAAAVDSAAGYTGAGQCSVCHEYRDHRFRLGIGTDLVMKCPHCETVNGVSVSAQATPCQRCGTSIRPDLIGDEDVACDICIRAGGVSFTQDTEFGMVRWEDAVRGATHGVPGLRSTHLGPSQFALTPPNADGWVSAVIPSETLLELTRTPSYATIQGEQWLFHCSRPMTYIGPWDATDFDREADGKGEELFLRLVDRARPGVLDLIPDLAGVYMFRCLICGKLRGHWDLD